MHLNTYNHPRLVLTKQEALQLAAKLIELVGTADRMPSKNAAGVVAMTVTSAFNLYDDAKSSSMAIYVEENETI